MVLRPEIFINSVGTTAGNLLILHSDYHVGAGPGSGLSYTTLRVVHPGAPFCFNSLFSFFCFLFSCVLFHFQFSFFFALELSDDAQTTVEKATDEDCECAGENS